MSCHLVSRTSNPNGPLAACFGFALHLVDSDSAVPREAATTSYKIVSAAEAQC